MATQKWVGGAGVGLNWSTAFNSSDLNTTAVQSGYSVLSSVVVANGAALDLFADLSISLATFTPLSPNMISVFLYPQNQDGSYGDGQITSSVPALKTPAAPYWVGNIVLSLVAGVQVGTLTGIRLPPGSFVFVIQNNAGATMNGAGNVVKYWTYNLQVT